MRRFLNTKLIIVALVFSLVSLITGVTLTAISAAPDSSPSKQIETSEAAEIVPIPMVVEEGGSLQVAGGGFLPGQFVLFEIVVGGDVFPLLLGSGRANEAGAFVADTGSQFPGGVLPDILKKGNTYSITAKVPVLGHVASSPLVVVEKK